MMGTTLVEIRERIEALAAVDGEYLVRCGRTGDQPVPVSGLRFDGRATARNAVRVAEQYRTALRRYDPQVPYYDLIVCQETGPVVPGSGSGARSRGSRRATSRTLSQPVVNQGRDEPGRGRLVEFCHTVAAAVFETLSEAGYDGVESAVMDAYVELAETVGDPDELCLCLLESTASELDVRLSPADQADLLADAAARLEPPTDDGAPIDATLAALEERGLIGSYTRSPYSVGLDGGAGAVVVQISGYALSARDGRLPVLPVTLELCRHHSERLPQSLRVTAVDGGWQLTFVLADTVDQTGLVNAPIGGEV